MFLCVFAHLVIAPLEELILSKTRRELGHYTEMRS